jgi:hypothetical protein
LYGERSWLLCQYSYIRQSLPDPGLEAWLKGLSNRTNASRQAIVTILCPAVFGSTTMGKSFDDLPRRLLDVCQSRPERLKQMIQTSFIDGQTPLE